MKIKEAIIAQNKTLENSTTALAADKEELSRLNNEFERISKELKESNEERSKLKEEITRRVSLQVITLWPKNSLPSRTTA